MDIAGEMLDREAYKKYRPKIRKDAGKVYPLHELCGYAEKSWVTALADHEDLLKTCVKKLLEPRLGPHPATLEKENGSQV